MSKVFKIGITKNNNQKIEEVKKVEVVEGKGIIGDRHFKEFNSPDSQLTLIEIENIDYYNYKNKLNISYLDFRRNIVTKGLSLNELVGKIFYISNVKVEGLDLCRPCLHLQDKLAKLKALSHFSSMEHRCYPN